MSGKCDMKVQSLLETSDVVLEKPESLLIHKNCSLSNSIDFLNHGTECYANTSKVLRQGMKRLCLNELTVQNLDQSSEEWQQWSREYLELRRGNKACLAEDFYIPDVGSAPTLEGLDRIARLLIAWEWLRYCATYERGPGAAVPIVRDSTETAMLCCVRMLSITLELSKRSWGAKFPIKHNSKYNVLFGTIASIKKRTFVPIRNPWVRVLQDTDIVDKQCGICLKECSSTAIEGTRPNGTLNVRMIPEYCLPETVEYLALLDSDKEDFKLELKVLCRQDGHRSYCDVAHDDRIHEHVSTDIARGIERYMHMTPEERALRNQQERNQQDSPSDNEPSEEGIRAKIRDKYRLKKQKFADGLTSEMQREFHCRTVEIRSVEENLVEVFCGHRFGNECLKTWMSRSMSCPMCRAVFNWDSMSTWRRRRCLFPYDMDPDPKFTLAGDILYWVKESKW